MRFQVLFFLPNEADPFAECNLSRIPNVGEVITVNEGRYKVLAVESRIASEDLYIEEFYDVLVEPVASADSAYRRFGATAW